MHIKQTLISAGVLLALVLAACGGDDNGDGGGGDDSGGASPTAATTGSPSGGGEAEASGTAPEAETSEPSSDGGGGGPAAAELDACSLLTQEEVAAAIGQDVGAPTADNSIPPFASCRWEEDGITPVVTLSVYVGEDEDDAQSYFDFGFDDYPEVPDLGDEARRTQPIDEVDVLSGRYQFALGLYFVSENEDEEFEMAVELARLVLNRLP